MLETTTFGPLSVLPVINKSKLRLHRPGERPVGVDLEWNLLQASASEVGQLPPGIRFEQYGTPILFTRISSDFAIDRQRHRFESLQILWTLGPTLLSHESGAGRRVSRTYLFVPLALAGLGGILWTSMGTIDRNPPRAPAPEPPATRIPPPCTSVSFPETVHRSR